MAATSTAFEMIDIVAERHNRQGVHEALVFWKATWEPVSAVESTELWTEYMETKKIEEEASKGVVEVVAGDAGDSSVKIAEGAEVVADIAVSIAVGDGAVSKIAIPVAVRAMDGVVAERPTVSGEQLLPVKRGRGRPTNAVKKAV